MFPRLRDDACHDPVIVLNLQRLLIWKLQCNGGPHHAADGWRDLYQPSRIGMLLFEELGSARMTPRDLIGMTCCGGVVFQTFTRYGHVFPELATLHPPSWARSGFLAHQNSTAVGSETTHAQRSEFPILAAEPRNSTNAFLISTSHSEGNIAEPAALVFTNPVLITR